VPDGTPTDHQHPGVFRDRFAHRDPFTAAELVLSEIDHHLRSRASGPSGQVGVSVTHRLSESLTHTGRHLVHRRSRRSEDDDGRRHADSLLRRLVGDGTNSGTGPSTSIGVKDEVL
jgi:hypothetical protein